MASGHQGQDPDDEVVVVHEGTSLHKKLPAEIVDIWNGFPQFKDRYVDFMKFVLDQGIRANVTFLVRNYEGDLFPAAVKAHKAMLIDKSDFFKTMFSDRWTSEEHLPKSGELEIDLRNFHVTASEFKKFLEFLYIGQTELTGSNVLAIYHLSNMYQIEELKIKCETFLQNFVDDENAFIIFSSVYACNAGKYSTLLQKIIDYICGKGKSILDRTEMLKLTREQLTLIFSNGQMNCRQLRLMHFCIRWVRMNMDPKILMDHSRFDSLMRALKVRTFFPYFPHLTSAVVADYSGARPNQVYRFRRFEHLERYNSWTYRPRHADEVSFRVSTPVYLTGIGLYGDKRYEPGNVESRTPTPQARDAPSQVGKYDVTIKLHVHGKKHQELRHISKRAGLDMHYITKIFKIDINACYLQPGEWYTISVVMNGAPSYYGSMGIEDKLIMCGDLPVIIEFQDADSGRGSFTNATGMPLGQIPELYFKIAANLDDDDDIQVL